MSQPSHRRQAPPVVVARATGAARLLPALLCALAACGDADAGALTVVLDSTEAGSAVEVMLLPADPAPLLVPPPPPPRDTLAARWRVLADSAALLDRRFQAERDAINRDVRGMEGGDRRSGDYARRFDAVAKRTATAESLRAARDRLRRRAERIRPPGMPDPTSDAAARARLLAMRDGNRAARALRPTGTVAEAKVAPGAWWVGIAPAGRVPADFRRVDVRAGGRDTLRP